MDGRIAVGDGAVSMITFVPRDMITHSIPELDNLRYGALPFALNVRLERF